MVKLFNHISTRTTKTRMVSTMLISCSLFLPALEVGSGTQGSNNIANAQLKSNAGFMYLVNHPIPDGLLH
jgi:hypothetical protein